MYAPGMSLPQAGVAKLLLRMTVLVRCFRIIRLTRELKGVTTMLYTLYKALPAVGNIGLLLVVLLYMYAVAGMVLFQDIIHHGGLTHIHNFDHFGNACWTLFLICTGDIWPDVMYNCMYTGSECSDEEGNCGYSAAALYFVSLVSLVSFLLLNMFVTILVGQFIEARRIFQGKVTMTDLEDFRDQWSVYDDVGTGYIAPHQLVALLIDLSGPLSVGLNDKEMKMAERRRAALKTIGELELMDYGGKANFAQVLCALSERAHAAEVAGSDMSILRKMVAEQAQAIPVPDSVEINFHMRCAGNMIMRHMWRKKYVNNLRLGIIPGAISRDFKAGVMDTREGQVRAARTLINVVDMVWAGFPEEEERQPSRRRGSRYSGAPLPAHLAELAADTEFPETPTDVPGTPIVTAQQEESLPAWASSEQPSSPAIALPPLELVPQAPPTRAYSTLVADPGSTTNQPNKTRSMSEPSTDSRPASRLEAHSHPAIPSEAANTELPKDPNLSLEKLKRVQSKKSSKTASQTATPTRAYSDLAEEDWAQTANDIRRGSKQPTKGSAVETPRLPGSPSRTRMNSVAPGRSSSPITPALSQGAAGALGDPESAHDGVEPSAVDGDSSVSPSADAASRQAVMQDLDEAALWSEAVMQGRSDTNLSGKTSDDDVEQFYSQEQ